MEQKCETTLGVGTKGCDDSKPCHKRFTRLSLGTKGPDDSKLWKKRFTSEGGILISDLLELSDI